MTVSAAKSRDNAPRAASLRAASPPKTGVSLADSQQKTADAVNTRQVAVENKTKKVGDDEKDGGEKKPKKRVRLKPETPEKLIERLRNPQLSLHEASILLRVSRATVRRYADSGRLVCQRTPGGQRRFFLRDIENFYRQLKLKR